MEKKALGKIHSKTCTSPRYALQIKELVQPTRKAMLVRCSGILHF